VRLAGWAYSEDCSPFYRDLEFRRLRITASRLTYNDTKSTTTSGNQDNINLQALEEAPCISCPSRTFSQ